MRLCLLGDALAAFNTAATQLGDENNENFQEACHRLISHVFPRRALQTQKRYMRRFLRKKADGSVRAFMTRLVEINEYLSLFPEGFNENQKLPLDEIMDIAEFGVPATWQRIMLLHTFDPIESTPEAFVAFCERIECAEGEDSTDKKKSSKKSPPDLNARIPRKRVRQQVFQENPKESKFCDYHQVYGHTTGECRDVKKLIQEKRAAWGNTNKKPYVPTFKKNKKEGSSPDACKSWK